VLATLRRLAVAIRITSGGCEPRPAGRPPSDLRAGPAGGGGCRPRRGHNHHCPHSATGDRSPMQVHNNAAGTTARRPFGGRSGRGLDDDNQPVAQRPGRSWPVGLLDL